MKNTYPIEIQKEAHNIGLGNNDYRFGLECLPSKKVQ